jgi:hypothetical protein
MKAKRSQLGTAKVEASEIKGLSRKQLGEAQGGDPDEWDIKNIQAWIDLYEKAYPGQIRKVQQDMAVELALSGRTKDYGEISNQSETRLVMTMPGNLQEVLQRAYPSVWTNPKHLAWFLRHFPQFKAAPKY